MHKCLGVEKCNHPNCTYELKRPYLIERIVDVLCLTITEPQKIPTHVASPLLHKDLDRKDRMNTWSYRSVIGMSTHLQVMSRPDISMAVHQCARYSSFPKLSHERAVTRIGRCLIDTKNRGVIRKEDNSRGLECFVDAYFSGG